MAQAAVKICEICASGPGSHFCLDCEQLYCDHCKSLHTRQKIGKTHTFQDGSEVIPEVKSKCEDHNEDVIFMCTTCDVSVCTRCVVGNHKGHEMSSISELLTVLKDKASNSIKSKYEVIKENIQQLETGFNKMDKDVTTVMREVTEEGEKIKAMIDRHIQKIIADLRKRGAAEKEKLTKIISEAKSVLVKLDQLEAGRLQLEKHREDAGLIKKLKSFNDDIIKVQVVSIPDLPSVVYKAGTPTEDDINSLMGSFVLSELKFKTTDENISKLTKRPDVDKEKNEGYLHICSYCGYHGHKINSFCPKCGIDELC